MNDSKPSLVFSGQSPDAQGHTSEQESVRITQEDDVPELVEFVLTLKMRRPVSTDKAARLLEHMVKHQMTNDSSQIADQMRDDSWETDLSEGETLALLADRVLAYLATHEGIALFNFFVKTFANASGEMFD